jgi:YidC/Oxa1 family membrane protein insertase
VSDPQQFRPIGPKKDKFSPEMRILAASLLSMGVILLWAKYFGPKPPATLPTKAPAAQTAPANPGAASQPNSATPSSAPHGIATSISSPAATAIPAKADSQERTVVIENDLYRVEISNRGAVVKSWKLKKYLDDSKPQGVLDVVHPETSKQTGGWPFSLAMDDSQMEAAANGGLYQVSTASSSLSAPADAEFSWSDGRLEVTKHFYFDHTYVVRVETSVKYGGAPVTAGLAWRGGFGDLTVTNPVPVETVTTYYAEGGKLTTFAYKKLDGPEKWGGTWQGGKDYVGIADRYFTAAFLPANGAAPGTLETRYWRVFHSIQADGKEASEAVPEVAAAARSQQPQVLRVYVGPKDYDDLKKMNPPLHALVQFGWMEFIADPLFHLLKWLHAYIPNWGWAIVVLTLVINMLLFPLRITSYKTTMKMQRVAPEIKTIQDRYKKYKMNDPRKAEMNKEVMAVYSREGINPLGSCFQMFLQMPIWFGLNTALRYAIELRHAKWAWITDLSAKDPYYVLPVVVGVTMYLVSKMTPMTSTDPQQQQMMKLMPISFAVMFVVFPFSSGLALYILTSSLVGIGQQWYLNRAHPVTAPVKPARGKK